MNFSRKKIGATNLLIFFIFLLDRLTKWWALNFLEEKHSFIPKVLIFQLYKNPKISFGLSLPPILIYIFAGFILLTLTYFLVVNYKRKNFFYVVVLTLISAGAISNLLDRIKYGFVVDFVHLAQLSVFNLADLMIFAGVILLLVQLLKSKKI